MYQSRYQAEFRKIRTTIWNDSWFFDLSPNTKLLFIYLFSNSATNAAGAYEIPPKRIEIETALSRAEVEEGFEELQARVTRFADSNFVFIHNFLDHQGGGTGSGSTTGNSGMAEGARKVIASLPENVASAVLERHPNLGVRPSTHHLQTVPRPSLDLPKTPVRQGEGDGDVEGEREREHTHKGARVDSRYRSDAFESFWSAYPKKAGKREALKAWESLDPSEELQGQIIAAVKAQKGRDEWQTKEGRFIPHPAKWLNGGHWEDAQPSGPERKVKLAL